MSAEYSVEDWKPDEIRAHRNAWFKKHTQGYELLTMLAQRIEADERAVPVADWRIGMFDRWNEAAQEKGYAGICEAINAVPTAATPPASPVGVPDGWAAFNQTVTWLRAQANAEKEPLARAAFIEAHNAAKLIKRDVLAAPSAMPEGGEVQP